MPKLIPNNTTKIMLPTAFLKFRNTDNIPIAITAVRFRYIPFLAHASPTKQPVDQPINRCARLNLKPSIFGIRQY